MDLTSLLIISLIIIAVGFMLNGFLKMFPKNTDPIDSLLYVKEPFLLSKAERSFLGVLEQSIGDNYRIFSKVRVADVISVQNNTNQKNRTAAFNKIKAKHFDFIIVGKEDFSIIGAVELDDKSHKQSDRLKRDIFLNTVCETAGLKLFRFEAKKSYLVKEIRHTLDEYLCNNALNTEPESVKDEVAFFKRVSG